MAAKDWEGNAWEVFSSNKDQIAGVVVEAGTFVTFEIQMRSWAVMESHGVWRSPNS